MPLGSLREQLTFPDSYAALVAARRSSSTTPVAVAPPPAGSAGGAPAASGGSGGKGGGKDGKDGGDSGDEEGGHVSPTVASSGSRRLPFVRGSGSGSGSGGGGAAAVAAGGYRRVSTEADLGSGEGAGGLGSAATDAELRELLTTACLPNLLARWARGRRRAGPERGQRLRSRGGLQAAAGCCHEHTAHARMRPDIEHAPLARLLACPSACLQGARPAMCLLVPHCLQLVVTA